MSARTSSVLTLLFFCLGIFGVLHHEIWLDEAHHFLLARDSNSISELAYNARYDGHPLLWNVVLFVITRFTHDPLWMQVANVLIMSLAVFIFLRRAPLKATVKIMIVFSYYFLFEYTVISRNYALGVLLLVLACSLLFAEKKNYALIFGVLLLLAGTHLYSLFIAVALSLVAVYDYSRTTEGKIPRSTFSILYVVFISAVLLLVWIARPPADHFIWNYDPDPYLSFKRIGKGASVFFKGLFPFPNITRYNCWNTNIFVDLSKNLSIIPSALCLLIPAVLFHKHRQALWLFYVAGLAIALFIFISPVVAASRYFGFIFQLFVAALWAMKYFPEGPSFFGSRLGALFEKVNGRFAGIFIGSVLVVQVASGILFYVLDAFRPFSESKHVAEYIQQNRNPGDIIAVRNHSTGPPISAHLDRKLFYVENNSLQSFCLWNTNPYMISDEEMYERVAALRQQTPDSVNVLLVLSFTRGETPHDNQYDVVYRHAGVDYRLLKQFDNGMVRSENYQLFEVTKPTGGR